MKKTIPIFAGLLALALPGAVRAQSYYTNSYGVWSYTTTDGAVMIIQFEDNGSNAVVAVPGSINGLPVTALGEIALGGDSMLSVTVPNSVTSIRISAFTQCSYLTNALIGSGVTNIEGYAFQGDNNLKAIYFLGNAPHYSTNGIFFGDNSATVYYLPSTTGWTNTFAGLPTMPWNPPLPPLGVATYSNQPVLFFATPAAFPASIGTNYALQMSTNLASSNWVTVTSGVALISIQITNVPSNAFFRLQ